MTESKKPEKRKYTVSDKALEQRRANQPKATESSMGLHTGPITEDGKAASSRNGWVHGRYSAIHRAQFGLGATSVAKLFGKPCVTTCPFHPDNPERTEKPCGLVLDGLTHAGGSCLDKTVYVHALDALMGALKDGDMEGMNGILATEMASTLQMLHSIREEISRAGLMIEIPVVLKHDGESTIPINPKTGEAYIADVRANPILAHLIKMTESLGINFAELMATPRARQKLADDDAAADGLQTAIGRIFARAGARANAPAQRPALEHED